MSQLEQQLRARRIILYPIVSEKTVRMIETENKITFAVALKASKRDIKWAIETLYDVKIEKVNTMITHKGYKKAYVKLAEGYSASDLAIKLGIL